MKKGKKKRETKWKEDITQEVNLMTKNTNSNFLMSFSQFYVLYCFLIQIKNDHS